MDFTYILALFLGLMVGLTSTIGHRFARQSFSKTSAAITLALAMMASGFLLINWPGAGAESVGFVVLDLTIIAVFTLFGCIAGAPQSFVALARR